MKLFNEIQAETTGEIIEILVEDGQMVEYGQPLFKGEIMKKILIANRGEIAVRIIRAAHDLGIQTVAIYSEGDKDALHTQIADEAYCVSPTLSKDSYLNIPNILSIATSTGCDGVHPGYGFG